MVLQIPGRLENYIGGEFTPPHNGQYLDNVNPASGAVYGYVPDSTHADVQAAVEAAQAAFPAWKNMPAEQRFLVLNRIASLVDEHMDTLALAETNDNGKPLWLSKSMDIYRAAANFRFFATGLMHVSAESHGMENRGLNYTLRQPIGVVACISPWNLPLYLFTWKIAPALAAGNCVIAKPSEVTPVTAYLLAQICKEAGLPDGVLNIIHGTGPGCGEAMVTHPSIKAISFTGSTRAGSRIAAMAAPKFKKLSLELGGKNPTIIFADCDWDKMLDTVMRSSFSNQGQICLCGSRILIEANVYKRFRAAFGNRARALKIGDPLEKESQQGAIVSKLHFGKIMAAIETAKQEGGTVLCGGKAFNPGGRCENGYFIEPTIIENLGAGCSTNQEEIFGPVVTLQPFDSAEEAIQLANDSGYGLAASVWTNNISIAHKAAAQLECGIVWINCWLVRDLRTPFGGIKNSGMGREGGWEAMRFFTEAKNVCIEL